MKDHASRINIYASLEDFMPHINYVSRENIHFSQKFMHLEKISCLAKIMHREEIFMPRRKLCIARRYSYLAEIYTLWEDIHTTRNQASREDIHALKKSCATREGIVHLKGNIYPSTSTVSLFGNSECQDNHRKKQKINIKIASTFIYFAIK